MNDSTDKQGLWRVRSLEPELNVVPRLDFENQGAEAFLPLETSDDDITPIEDDIHVVHHALFSETRR